MKRRVALLGIAAAVVTWPSLTAAGASDILVIVNKANPISRISREELRPIFLSNKSTWSSGKAIEALNLPESSEVRQQFDSVVLGMDSEKVAQYWIDRKIRGDSKPPKKLPNASSVLRRVAASQGAVGYTYSSDVDSSVKIVARVRDGRVVGP